MRASTSASQACGSTPLSSAETKGQDGEPIVRVANVVEIKDAADLSPEIAAAIAEVFPAAERRPQSEAA